MADKEDGEMDVTSPEIVVSEMKDETTEAVLEPPVDTTPCQVDRQLDFVAVNEMGHLLMGSSSLTGRYWGGALWYYEEPMLAPAVEKCLVGYEINSGLAVGAFIDASTVVVGQDCGSVEFLSIKKEEELVSMRSLCRADEHLDAVLCLSLTADAKTLITGSADMSIRLWDCQTSLVKQIFHVAHSQQVTDVSPHPSNDQLFLSSGMDGNVLLWDLRCPKPASCIFRDWDDKPECVLWLGSAEADSSREDHYLVGLQSGTVALRSTTNFHHSLTTASVLSRPLYRMASNPKRPTQVAVCGNDSKTLVLNIAENNIQISYEDDWHEDFVRGLAWRDNNSLITCGWDKNVLIHNI